jgi:hypothetical protein
LPLSALHKNEVRGSMVTVLYGNFVVAIDNTKIAKEN